MLNRYSPETSTGTLLLIDDEPRLRQLLARVLELEGYTALQAPDATRDLELLQQHADSPPLPRLIENTFRLKRNTSRARRNTLRPIENTSRPIENTSRAKRNTF